MKFLMMEFDITMRQIHSYFDDRTIIEAIQDIINHSEETKTKIETSRNHEEIFDDLNILSSLFGKLNRLIPQGNPN
jgi:hypothetical protein